MRKGKAGKKSQNKRQNQTKRRVQRKYKDKLFRLVFKEKKDLLMLYNAIHDTDYQDEEQLEIITLDDMLFMGVKNDLSFLINHEMNLYEHQSTVNPNMPLRGLDYFTELYRNYVKKIGANIYGSARIWLPYPQYIIFYNGTEYLPDRSTVRLSDSYLISEGHKKEASLECTATIININLGRNHELMKKCARLEEYARFVACVRELSDGRVTEEVMEKAIDLCIKEGVLADVLTKHRREVKAMFQEYNEEAVLRGERKIGYDRGKIEGKIEGKIDDILALLECRGKVSNELREKITSERSIETLKEWVRIAASSDTVSEFADRAYGKDR